MKPTPSYPSNAKVNIGVGSSIEDQIRFKHFSPAPNTYHPNIPAKKVESTNGLIKDGHFPSFSDPPAGDTPGPGAYPYITYPAGELPLPNGGRVYHKNKEKVMEGKGLIGPKLAAQMLREYSGSRFPDPIKYFPNMEPVRPKLSKLTRFNKQPRFPRPYGHETNPESGTYNSQKAMDFLDPFLPEGGKNVLSQHKPAAGYFDEVPMVTQDIPGPGMYQPKLMPDKMDFSQATYRHTTDTMEETKKLVGRGHETPGPGAYNLPDLGTVNNAPKFQSRILPYAVPRPYHYNSQPDLGRKFVPIRSSNSGDLIFGRNFRTGNDTIFYQSNIDRNKGVNNANQTNGTMLTNDTTNDTQSTVMKMSAAEIRLQDEQKRKELKRHAEEEVTLFNQEFNKKDSFDAEKPKWVEGGYEIFDPSYTQGGEYANGQPDGGGLPPGQGSRYLGADGQLAIMDENNANNPTMGVGGSSRHRHSKSTTSLLRKDYLNAKVEDLRDEHPAILRAASNYQAMSGKVMKPIKGFLPGAQKRCVAIDADENSATSFNYDVAKKQYVGVSDALENATKSLMGEMKKSLPMKYLMHYSEEALRDKAVRKMALDGIRLPIAEKILEQMPRIFEKPSGSNNNLMILDDDDSIKENAALEDELLDPESIMMERPATRDTPDDGRPGTEGSDGGCKDKLKLPSESDIKMAKEVVQEIAQLVIGKFVKGDYPGGGPGPDGPVDNTGTAKIGKKKKKKDEDQGSESGSGSESESDEGGSDFELESSEVASGNEKVASDNEGAGSGTERVTSGNEGGTASGAEGGTASGAEGGTASGAEGGTASGAEGGGSKSGSRPGSQPGKDAGSRPGTGAGRTEIDTVQSGVQPPGLSPGGSSNHPEDDVLAPLPSELMGNSVMNQSVLDGLGSIAEVGSGAVQHSDSMLIQTGDGEDIDVD